MEMGSGKDVVGLFQKKTVVMRAAARGVRAAGKKAKKATKEESKKHPSEAFGDVDYIWLPDEVAEYENKNPDTALGKNSPPDHRNALQHLCVGTPWRKYATRIPVPEA